MKIIDIINENGVWRYADNEQAELCSMVLFLNNWEITGFDDWLNTDAHWVDHPGLREKLIDLRHQLTRTFRKYISDNYVLELEAERLFAVAQWTAFYVKGCDLERKVKVHSEAQSKRRAGKSKLSDLQQKTIRRKYKAALSPYGVVKQLAREYDVSTATISQIVNGKRHMTNDSQKD